MRITPISANSKMANYSSVKEKTQNHSAVSFEKGNVKTLTTALALALLGVTASASASASTLQLENEIENENVELLDSLNNIVGPQDNMGEYYKKYGFTPAQREAIADSTILYASTRLNEMLSGVQNAFNECSYFHPKEDSPSNPYALNLDYHMGKAYENAKALTKYRQDIILAGGINTDHYIPNPELDPIADNKDAIGKILKDTVSYEQFVADNAETIDKLNKMTVEERLNLTNDEIQVFSKMRQIIKVVSDYVREKGTEYRHEADSSVTQIMKDYDSDMRKISIFRNEKNNLENTFITSTPDGQGINPDFKYWATREGFRGAAIKEFYKLPKEVRDSICNLNANNNKPENKKGIINGQNVITIVNNDKKYGVNGVELK